MLHIATMLGIASPFVLEHRFTIVFRSWLKLALHLALVFGIAAMVYGLLLMTFTETYPPGRPMATALYGVGLALAGLLAICAGTLTAPERLARLTFLGTSALAILLPLGLYVRMAAGGEMRAGYIWYLVGGIAGSVAATRLMPYLRAAPKMSRT
jgi:vacuolar-type H+-ATPase subunit I/STV1